MNRLSPRSQLQVDASPSLKQALKKIAAEEGISIKQLVLTALEDKYPQISPQVSKSLGRMFEIDK
jgi:hypothetical protein